MYVLMYVGHRHMTSHDAFTSFQGRFILYLEFIAFNFQLFLPTMEGKLLAPAAVILAIALLNASSHVLAFAPIIQSPSRTSALSMVVEIGPTEDDVDPPLPGQMKISEIKSELDLRRVDHGDCFDRESLELRL